MIIIKTKPKVKTKVKGSVHEADQYFDEARLVKARSQSDLSRERLVYMKIDDFLALARGGFDKAKERTVSLLLRDKIPLDSIPYLKVENAPEDDEEVKMDNSAKSWQVDGHEGRHRARALHALGIKEIPVVIIHATMRWGKSKTRPKYVWAEKPKTDALLFKDIIREA